MDEATKEVRNGTPRELAYADDLVLTAESKQGVMQLFDRWREGLEARGLKVNMDKTKLMITGKETRQNINVGRWPCGFCGKGVGVNSILCVKCNRWCHQKCSGLMRVSGVKHFQCPACTNLNKTNIKDDEEGVVITSNGMIREVSEFCYLGDVVDNVAGVEHTVRTRVAAAWKKWREVVSLLLNKNITLKIRGNVYEACVRSVMLYGSETWAMSRKMEGILIGCDRRMLRYMAGVKWQDMITSEKVAQLCGVKEIAEKLRHRRLQWYGHVKRDKDGGALRTTEEMEVAGKRSKGRPKKTWLTTVRNDMDLIGVDEKQAMDRAAWRKVIKSPTPNLGKKGLKNENDDNNESKT